MGAHAWIEKELLDLSAAGLERRLVSFPHAGARLLLDGKSVLNFSSNDYLGLAQHSCLAERAKEFIDRFGCSSSASRLLTGTLVAHSALEEKLAAFFHTPRSLVFGSGYLTNLGVVTSLVARNDIAMLDRLAHASLVDAAILSRAKLKRFQHNDLTHLEALLREARGGSLPETRILVATESVFSMDGDIAPVRELVALTRRYQAMLVIDEAHAVGVFGRGIAVRENVVAEVDALVGTLSKALASYGGFVGCGVLLQRLLVTRARTFIYDTALPPAAIGAAIAALELIEADETPGEMLLRRADRFRKQLTAEGFDTGHSASQIVPLVIGDNQKTMRFSELLREQGILSLAIRPPTVPPGMARLRFSLSAAHTEADLEEAVSVIAAVGKKLGII